MMPQTQFCILQHRMCFPTSHLIIKSTPLYVGHVLLIAIEFLNKIACSTLFFHKIRDTILGKKWLLSTKNYQLIIGTMLAHNCVIALSLQLSQFMVYDFFPKNLWKRNDLQLFSSFLLLFRLWKYFEKI